MPRPAKIDESAVESAVKVLKDNHTPINPYQVRKILGEGSVAKIAYFLKALGHTTDYSGEKEDPLTLKMVNLLRPAVLELDEQSKERIRVATEQLNKELEERDSLVSNLERQAGEKQSLIDAIETKLSTAITERDEARGKCQKLEINLARLDEKVCHQADQLKTASEQIQQKTGEAARARQETQEAIEEHKVARRIMQENHQTAINSYKEALDERNEDYAKASNELVDLWAAHRDTEHQLQENKRQHHLDKDASARAAKSYESTISGQQNEITELKDQCAQFEQQLVETQKTAQARIHETQQELSSVSSKNATLSSDNARLEVDLAFLRSLIEKFEIPKETIEKADAKPPDGNDKRTAE